MSVTHAIYEPDSLTDPRCCDEPMVRNVWAGRWECAAAFFALLDAGVTEDNMERWSTEDGTGDLEADLRHWRESWVPSELVWCAAERKGLQYHRLLDTTDGGTVQTFCGPTVRWSVDGQVTHRGWTGLRGGLPGMMPCPACWPTGDPDALPVLEGRCTVHPEFEADHCPGCGTAPAVPRGR